MHMQNLTYIYICVTDSDSDTHACSLRQLHGYVHVQRSTNPSVHACLVKNASYEVGTANNCMYGKSLQAHI